MEPFGLHQGGEVLGAVSGSGAAQGSRRGGVSAWRRSNVA